MKVTLELIQGCMIGFELFEDEDGNYLVLDLLLVRVVAGY